MSATGVWGELDWPRQIALGLLTAALLVAVGLLAWHRARPPERCADGLVAHGARCCGASQTFDGIHCRGVPTHCAAGQVTADTGCVPTTSIVSLAAGTLSVAPTDWEAAQQGVRHYQVPLPGFGIDSHEVTEGAYAACVAADVCAPLEQSAEPGLPRVGITADEAAEYCAFAGGRLPTADEWMFAASGEGARRYPWGQTGAVCRRAAFGLAAGPCARDGRGPELAGAHPEGATPDGVFDMSGNAAEWTVPAKGQSRVKGGSWRDASATELRSWYERKVDATARDDSIGFRCVHGAPRLEEQRE